MPTIPKASIHDLINLTNTSTNSQSAQANNKPYNANPVSDFISTLMKYAQPTIHSIQNNPQVKDVINSPGGQLIQGNFNKVIPAVKQEWADLKSGKYKPQFSFNGEMEEVPGMGFDPATSLPKPGSNLTPPKNTTASMIRDESGNFVPNPNREAVKPNPDYGTYNNTPNEPFHEQMPQKQSSPEAKMPEDKQPWQEFSDNQKSYAADPSQKAVRQINPASFSKENDPIGTVNAIHETLDRHGISQSTAEEQLAQLPKVRNQLYHEAQAKLAADPDNASIQTVQDNINTELASQTRLKDITKPAAKEAIDEYTKSLYNQARGTSNEPVPAEIPYKTLFDMKTQANQDYASVQKSLDNNTPLTDIQKVNYAYRNGLDKTITARYPGVKQDTMDMSNLYKAQTPLAKAVPKFEVPAPKQTFFDKAKSLGIGVGGLGIGAREFGLNPIPAIQSGLGFVEHGVNQMYNNLTKANGANNQKNQGNQGSNSPNGLKNNHGNSMTQFDANINTPADIPQDQNSISQNPDGTYGIANIYTMKDPSDPTGSTSLFISPENAKQQQLQIDAAKNTLLYKNSQAEQVRVGKLDDQLKTQLEFTKQIQQPYTSSQIKNNAYSLAIKDAQLAAPDIANFNGTYDQFIQQLDPRFADLKTQLQTLEKEGAVNPNGMIKGATLINALQTAAKGNLMNFYGQLNNITGFTGQGKQNIQNTPVQPSSPTPSIPQDFNIGGGSLPSLQGPQGLPPINSIPAQ